MKVIHIAGWSGSGKTTFIVELIVALSQLGPVGTIKHIADHICEPEAGKDTTLHYQAGAMITGGIDQEKTMLITRTTSLPECLSLLSDAGIMYAVIEGFKLVPFRKVVIGSLDIPALLRDPTVPEVISRLCDFDEYYTLSGLYHEVEKEPGSGDIYTLSGYTLVPLHQDDCLRIEKKVLKDYRITNARFRCNVPVFQKSVSYYALTRAESPEAAILALRSCVDELAGESQEAIRTGPGDHCR